MTAPDLLTTATGLRVHHAPTAEALVAALRRCWQEPPADVFDSDLAVVPGPGFQRWLSQQLAADADRPGICAGVEFCSLPALVRRLAGDDPWQPPRLAWPLQRVALAGDDPHLADLRRHLDASREPYSACLRIARQFEGYATHRPAMLAAWADGHDVAPDGFPLGEHAWQAALWRKVAAELGGTPAAARADLLTQLRRGPVDDLPKRIAVVAPSALDRAALDLLAALGEHLQVDLLLLTPTPARRPIPQVTQPRADFRRPIGHPLNDALAAVADERALLLPPSPAQPEPGPATLLGWLQSDLRADGIAGVRTFDSADDSVQLHLSHGPDRQVEVLREVLAGLLASDPTLEPRDIVVVTPQLDAVAPLVTAAFMLPGATNAHPGHRFRVQLADRSVAQTNPMVSLLLQLLALPDSRFEASALLDLCAQPAVAARFGFTDDRHDRLVELVQRSGIRWGLSAAHRARFGLGQYPQNTWLAGVQRMLLGVALPETDLVTARTVLPLDDIDSSDVELVGGLAELIGRLSRLVTAFEEPATMAEWAARCRSGLESLVSLGFDQEWQLGDVWAGLARAAASGDETRIGRHGVLRVLTAEFTDRPARGAFGNGSLIVCGRHSLRHVPHRVVVLLGWVLFRAADLTQAANFLLGLVNGVTKDKIAAIEAEKTRVAMSAVVPEGSEFTDALEIPQAAIDAAKAQGGTVSELYGVTNGGAEAGYVAKVAASGSQGTITMMVGIDANGAITGISVVSHSETSGIGTKVVENKPNAAGTPVLDQFIGMSGAGTLAVGSNITAISGATVSTKGITMGANAALAAVEALG